MDFYELSYLILADVAMEPSQGGRRTRKENANADGAAVRLLQNRPVAIINSEECRHMNYGADLRFLASRNHE